MTDTRDRKLYLGPRLRLLRRELGLNQARMADELGISPSYLNHLERNQRPFTAAMLLRLAQTYDLDVRGFVAGSSDAVASDLHEVLADPLVRDIGVLRQEATELAENYPGVAEAMRRLYRALGDLREVPERLEGADAGGQRLASPLQWLRGWWETRRGYHGEIDEAAEALAAAFGDGAEGCRDGLLRQLQESHGIGVRIVPAETLAGTLTHFDHHRRRLLMSERLPAASRLFATAALAARMTLGAPIAAALDRAAPPDGEARALAGQALVNYAAAALVMPYGRFHTAAAESRYAMDLLADRFGASWEQVAHRLTTLDRPGARGVPLFMLKIDSAGNVAKRFAPDALPLARYGGGCPRWRVHRAVARRGETVVDRAAMPDGSAYLTWARAIAPVAGDAPSLIVLGCTAAAADPIGYAAEATSTTPVGPACHLCERPACPDRSLPPITRALQIDPNRRRASPYSFRSV